MLRRRSKVRGCSSHAWPSNGQSREDPQKACDHGNESQKRGIGLGRGHARRRLRAPLIVAAFLSDSGRPPAELTPTHAAIARAMVEWVKPK